MVGMADHPGLTNDEFMELVQVFLRRRTELLCEEIETDRVAMASMDLWDSSLVRAHWSKFMRASIEATAKKPVSEQEKLSLFTEVFAEDLGLPSSEFPDDVEARLASAKTRIGKDLEREIRAATDRHEIRSPIEAIFLIEWKAMRVGETYELRLAPQRPVVTDRGRFSVDFLVTSMRDESLNLAIELDGHDFHEKTKKQAASDRARERAIIRQGLTVLRFTGAEIFRSARSCITEVLQHAGRLPPD